MVEATCRVDRFPLIANSLSILFAHAGVSQFTYELPADILYHQKKPAEAGSKLWTDSAKRPQVFYALHQIHYYKYTLLSITNFIS